MPKGLHGEIAHNDALNMRIDANVKERYRLVCQEEGVSMVEDLRSYIATRIEGRYPEIGRLTEMLKAIEEPRDEREPQRAHRQSEGRSLFPMRRPGS